MDICDPMRSLPSDIAVSPAELSELWNAALQLEPRKRLLIVSDSCYAGHWINHFRHDYSVSVQAAAGSAESAGETWHWTISHPIPPYGASATLLGLESRSGCFLHFLMSSCPYSVHWPPIVGSGYYCGHVRCGTSSRALQCAPVPPVQDLPNQLPCGS